MKLFSLVTTALLILSQSMLALDWPLQPTEAKVLEGIIAMSLAKQVPPDLAAPLNAAIEMSRKK